VVLVPVLVVAPFQICLETMAEVLADLCRSHCRSKGATIPQCWMAAEEVELLPQLNPAA
jgi:hypothetical protein